MIKDVKGTSLTKGWFKANTIVLPTRAGMMVNLDIRNGELTLEPSDNVNIFLCGITNSASSVDEKILISFILTKNSNGVSGVVKFKPNEYTPTAGQPFKTNGGFAVSPTEPGEFIPDTVILRLNMYNEVVISADRDITDVNLVSQYLAPYFRKK